MTGSGASVEFYTDPGEFLDRAGPLLAAEPVRFSITASVAARLRSGPAADLPYRPWFATVSDGGAVVGVAMRTAPDPFPLWLSRMPADAVRTIADRMATDTTVTCAVGESPAATDFVAALANRRGGRPLLTEQTRLFEFTEPTAPTRSPSGALRPARPDQLDLCLRWLAEFADAAVEQGGGELRLAPPGAAEVLARVERGLFHLWYQDGAPVHLTGHSDPVFGVVRIAPVYTPKPMRGRGIASSAVYELSMRFRADGLRVCLYTDQANPVSNAVYQAIGYRALADNVAAVVSREQRGCEATMESVRLDATSG